MVEHRSRRRHLHPPISPPTKELVCAAIIERAETIAAAVAARDPAVVRGIWDSFHAKCPELQARLLAVTMLMDEEPDLARGFVARLGQFVDLGETHVWDLPHPTPRYAGWMWRHGQSRGPGRS